ncbi:MAG: archaellin/type IV pilin N-terminal domain-containing protein, partial [Halobacteriales archaeon]
MVPGGDRRLTATVLSVGRDVRAQSGTIGVVLLLAITVISTGAIVTFGSEALIDTRQASQLQRTEHAMTLFDSRAAMVALGDSDVQTVSLGQESGGAYHIREDTGWIRVQHLNYTESASDPKNETIYNRSLGSIEYVNEDTVIAYQGGGVWRKTDNGSRMVSVPEFHYRAATLTLPVVRVTGSGSTAGRTQAVVTSTRQAHHVFPNRT